MQDENFKEIFKKILSDYQVCEFYIVDSSCSYLLTDKEGHTKFLMVRSISDFETIYELAKDSEAPYDVLQSIRDKQSYPFTRLEDPLPMLKGDAWEEAVVHLDKVPGRDIFYTVLDITSLETFPFKRYVNEIWPTP